MSELVAENERLSQLVSESHDTGGNTAVYKQDPGSKRAATGNGASADGGDDSLAAHASAAAMVHQIKSVVELMQETLTALNLARAEMDMKDHPPRRRRSPFGEKEDESDDDDDDDDDADDDDDDEIGYRWQDTAVQRDDPDTFAGNDSGGDAAGLGAGIARAGTGIGSRLERHHLQDDGSDSDDYWDVAEK